MYTQLSTETCSFSVTDMTLNFLYYKCKGPQMYSHVSAVCAKTPRGLHLSLAAGAMDLANLALFHASCIHLTAFSSHFTSSSLLVHKKSIGFCCHHLYVGLLYITFISTNLLKTYGRLLRLAKSRKPIFFYPSPRAKKRKSQDWMNWGK